MTARRHHYVPQCYLRGFVKERKSEVLYAVDLEDGRAFWPTTKNVAVEIDFHRVDSPGQPPDAVETQLANFDSDFAAALERITASRSFDDAKDRSTVFACVSLMFNKNPAMRETIDMATNAIANQMLQMQAANAEQWKKRMARAVAEGTMPPDADFEKMREHILNGDFTISMTREAHLLSEFKRSLELLPYVASRRWVLCRAPAESSGFISTDRPVSLMWQDALDDRPPGLGLPGTQILFSLSSELLIIGTFEGDERVADVDEEFVAACNGQLIRWCDRQVYARDEGFAYMLRHFEGMRCGADLPNDEICAFWRERDVEE